MIPQTPINVFKSLPAEVRKSIIDHIVNVQGLRSPRTKAAKDFDKEFYPSSLPGAMQLKKSLFNVCLHNHLNPPFKLPYERAQKI